MDDLKEIALQLKRINEKLAAILQEQKEGNKKFLSDFRAGSEGDNEGPSEK